VGHQNGTNHQSPPRFADDDYGGDHTLELPSVTAQPTGRRGSTGCDRDSREDRDSRDDRDNRGGERPRGRLQSNPLYSLSSLSHVIEATLPATKAEARRKLFEFCRHLKAIPNLADASAATLRPIVREWHNRTVDRLGLGAEFTDTMVAFMTAWPRVRVPAGPSPVELALSRAKESDPPEQAAALFEEPPILLLASICRELQRLTGEGPFFLDCRAAGRLVGLDHNTAWRLLNKVFCDPGVGILRAGKKGNKKKANRYFYVGG
jgi:hypothetical protein